MSRNKLLALHFNAQELAYALAYITMARPVETVTANRIFLIQLVGYGVHIRIIRHRLMESRIEHTHLRYARQRLLNRIYTLQVRRVMQRCQIRTLDHHCLHLVRYQYRRSKLLAAVNHAVTHCVNLLQVFDATYLRINQRI